MGVPGGASSWCPGPHPRGKVGSRSPSASAWPPPPSPRTDTWLLVLCLFLSVAAHLAPSEPVTVIVPRLSLCFPAPPWPAPLEGFASFECRGPFLKLRETKQYDQGGNSHTPPLPRPECGTHRILHTLPSGVCGPGPPWLAPRLRGTALPSPNAPPREQELERPSAPGPECREPGGVCPCAPPLHGGGLAGPGPELGAARCPCATPRGIRQKRRPTWASRSPPFPPSLFNLHHNVLNLR